MLKTEFKLNENRINADGRYSPVSVYDAVDKAFMRHRFRKEILSDGTICFYGNGLSTDYGAFGSLITSLRKKDWFMPYLDKWLWYNSDDGINDDDYVIEDILQHYKRKEIIS